MTLNTLIIKQKQFGWVGRADSLGRGKQANGWDALRTKLNRLRAGWVRPSPPKAPSTVLVLCCGHNKLPSTENNTPTIITQLPWVWSAGTVWPSWVFCLGPHKPKCHLAKVLAFLALICRPWGRICPRLTQVTCRLSAMGLWNWNLIFLWVEAPFSPQVNWGPCFLSAAQSSCHMGLPSSKSAGYIHPSCACRLSAPLLPHLPDFLTCPPLPL